MNILTGFISSTAGVVKVAGVDILENPVEVKNTSDIYPNSHLFT